MPKIKHLIQGKTVKEWAEHFKVQPITIYMQIRRGTLEARINGTYKRTRVSPAKKYEGKTIAEWAEIIGLSKDATYRYAKLGVLQDIVDGKYITGNVKHLVLGHTLKYWGDKLGMTRERARQLDDQGLLIGRINGEPPRQPDYSRQKAETLERYKELASKYVPGEGFTVFAKRMKLNVGNTRIALMKAGVKFQKQSERMEELGYTDSAEFATCQTCKHFKLPGPRYRCELGNFAITTKYGVCKKHEVKE
jgi:hypothetical protein